MSVSVLNDALALRPEALADLALGKFSATFASFIKSIASFKKCLLNHKKIVTLSSILSITFQLRFDTL